VSPKITIITPTIDTSHYVDEAIGSVPRDESGEIEHIVVHDGSSAFAQTLRDRYPWLCVMSGPGQGATAAVAAATPRATGDFVFLLNSDDHMLPGSIAALLRATASRPEIEVWTGGTRIRKNDRNGEHTVRILDSAGTTALTLCNVLDDLPLMTARFVRRSVYDRIGPFDKHFSACSDREFAIRMILAGVREASLCVRVSELRLHDESRTIRNPGSGVPPYLAQHIEIACAQMIEEKVPMEVRAAFRDWHARERLRKIYYELRARQLWDACSTIQGAFSCDVLWPWRLRSLTSKLRLRHRTDVPKLGNVRAS
jgi:glycosyltransferase involved in cell wall biosynthesis